MSDLNMQLLDMLAAASSDEEKKKRLDEIRAEAARLEEARAGLAKTRDEISALADQARSDKTAAEDAVAGLRERETAVAQEQAELAKVRDAMNAEKAAFEAVRTKVSSDHTERWESIRRKETALDTWRAEMIGREAEVSVREVEANEKHTSLDRRISALRAALEA